MILILTILTTFKCTQFSGIKDIHIINTAVITIHLWTYDVKVAVKLLKISKATYKSKRDQEGRWGAMQAVCSTHDIYLCENF